MYTLGLITTNHSKRFETLSKTIDSLNKQELRKIPKILSVDQLPGISTNHSFFNKFKEKGWKVVYKNHTGRNSMVTNQLNLLSNIDTEWVFYCEDDVSFRKIPSVSCLEKILNKDLGFISFNAHVHEFPVSETKNYCLDNQNYKKIDECYLLKKDKNIFQHKWYLNFPSCLIRVEHLRSCLQHASKRFANSAISIEEGLSYAWFELFREKGYDEFIILDNKPTKSVSNIFQEIHNNAIMNYWDNDLSTRIEPVNNKASMWF